MGGRLEREEICGRGRGVEVGEQTDVCSRRGMGGRRVKQEMLQERDRR